MLLLYGDWMVEVSEINGKKVITTDAFNVSKVSGAEMDDQWKMRVRI
jgi:sporulation protein YlmC with PRC-barrel domain